MARPDDRPLRRLPTLEARKATLERCVFCPKLCRSACPVSNADTRETVTPWGKMSMAYFVANESVALAPSFAAPAWACTGCFGCREQCDHRNDVAGTLFEARSALVAADAGAAPEGARRALERFDERASVLGRLSKELSGALPEVTDERSGTAVLVGCAYARRHFERDGERGAREDDEARDAVRATAKLVSGRVSVVDVCCGAPLLYAGDRARFLRQGERLAQAVKHAERLVVADAGCASTIRVHLANAGVGMIVPVVHFAELAATELARIGRVPSLAAGGPVRWHDPCQLGRGLGVYDAPRAILSRALGRAPDEFERRREDARCSGAGGLLPVTMPGVARTIAEQRLEDHARSGGGTVVTACASSLRSFERAGARALDLASVVARALEDADASAGAGAGAGATRDASRDPGRGSGREG
jgi:Fe-S oxidoreductase